MQKTDIGQLRFGCGASLQSAYMVRKYHLKKAVITKDKSSSLAHTDKHHKNGAQKG